MVFYIGIKYVNVRLSSAFIWYSLWFTGIIINALMSDLFQNTENWIFNSMYEIERKDITDIQKMKMLKEQLTIAVNRYDTIFFAINGKDWKAIFKRIYKGSITVKELIVITVYMLYDLVLKSGYLTLADPWDVTILLGILIFLKIIDSDAGFSSLVVEMYQKAFNEKYTSTTLDTIKGYIYQICNIFHINYDEAVASFDELTGIET